MDGELARTAARQGGFFYRWQALDCGYTEDEVKRLRRTKSWVPLRRGAYVTRAVHEGLDAAGKHRMLVRAVVGNLTGRVVVTGPSALVMLRVPIWGVDLDEVHVWREESKTARRDAGVVHHVGALTDGETLTVDGLITASPERSLLDACRGCEFEPGVVMADGARRHLRLDMDVALATLERQRDWSGSVTASRVLAFSSDRAETVGESRSRVLMARLGLPRPRQQYAVRDERRRLIGVTDFLLEEHGTVVEFDGKLKYGRELYERSGQVEDVDLGEVVWREKRREDAIRDAGYEVVRLVWSDLDGRDGEVRARFLRAFSRAATRRTAG